MLWSSAEEAAAAAGSSPLPSPISPGKAGDLGRSNLEVPAPHRALLALCATCIHIRIYLYVCVYICVCVRGYIQAEKPQVEPGEHQLSLGVVGEKTGRGQAEQNPGGLGMRFPRIFRFPLHFCITFPLVAVAVSRGHLPRSPRPVVSVFPRPGPLPSSWGCPGSISRSSSLELFLPSVLTGCSRCLLGVYKEKIWQGLPSQQSPICSKRT